jgi:hypothetical protein
VPTTVKPEVVVSIDPIAKEGRAEVAGLTVELSPVDTKDSVVREVGETSLQAITVLRKGEDEARFDVEIPQGFTLVPSAGSYLIQSDGRQRQLVVATSAV